MARKQTAAPASSGDPAQSLLASVTHECGPGSMIQMGDAPLSAWPSVSTGSIGLDDALGIGGLPCGRITEIYGPEGSGKTTLALHAVASVQKAGGIAVMIDAEHALDPEYAQKIGVDVPSLMLSQPDTGEQALQIADICVRSGVVGIVVIDSVAALVPRAELEGEMGDSHVGLQARLMSQALRKLTGAIGTTGTTCIFINQLREKIGIMFGNPETTTGGKALKFYASVRLDVRRIETLKDGQDAYGQKVRIKVVKNKMAPPFKQYETDIIWGRGFSRCGELIDLGVKYNVVGKAGAWYTFDGANIGQGKEKARQALEDNRHLAEVIAQQLRERMAAVNESQPAYQPPVPAPSPVDLLGPGSLADIVVTEALGGNNPETK